MTQLNKAIAALEAEHAAFMGKGNAALTRTEETLTEARSIANQAQTEETTAQGVLDQTTTARDAAGTAKTNAQTHASDTGTALRATHLAKRQVAEAVRQANQAKHTADALVAGNQDRYAHWLRNSPVANGTLHLDFANGSYQVWENGKLVDKTFAEAVTFTRASTATYWDANGVLQTAAVDEPRFDHDPVTGEALGLLVEESRTNLLPWSEDITQWGVDTGVSVTANQHTAPNNAVSMDEVAAVADASTDRRRAVTVGSYVSGGSGSKAVISGFFKVGLGCETIALGVYQSSLRFAWVSYNTTNGVSDVYVISDVGGVTLKEATEVEPGIWYLAVEHTDDASGYTYQGLMHFGNGDVASALRSSPAQSGAVGFWGAQLEAGTYPTSYIPTSGAAVTRSAESDIYLDLGQTYCHRSGTVFVDWTYGEGAGSGTYARSNSVLWRFQRNNGDSSFFNQFAWGRYNGRFVGTLRDVSDTGYSSLILDSGLPTPDLANLTPHKGAVSLEAGVGLRTSLDAEAGVFINDPEVPAVIFDRVDLLKAYDGTFFLGHKRAFSYYPYAMPQADLDALTA